MAVFIFTLVSFFYFDVYTSSLKFFRFQTISYVNICPDYGKKIDAV